MRDHLTLCVNGTRREVRGGDAFLTLSDWLRGRLGLVGTTIMCAEGDCGACTVLVAEPAAQGRPRYLPIDSCIRFLFQADGCHVVTVDGLARGGDLAPVQQAMIDCHGSQCGFCTRGFVVALAGNLCRCTGYVSIVEAAERAGREADWLAARFADDAWMREGVRLRREPFDVHGDLDGVVMRATSPATLDLASAAGTRSVPIDAFYTGYKQLDLAPDELLVRVRMPVPGPDDVLRLVKVSRRRDLDISTFTSAIVVRRTGDRIASARVAYGGVGATVVRMRATEAALAGHPFTEATFRRAGDVAVGEIRPLTDVRGSADYRLQLARSVLLKVFHEQTAMVG